MLTLCTIPKFQAERDKFYDQFPWLTSHGRYNTLPEPYSKSTMDKFLFALHNSGLLGISARQCVIKEIGRYANVKIYFFHKEAFALTYPIKNARCDVSDPIVYKIGCEHQFKELNVKECAEKGLEHYESCWHVYYCDKYGYHESQDSSD